MTETQMPAIVPELRSAFIADLRGVECRQAGNGEEFTLTGHAALFNSWSDDLWTFAGTFRERLAPGAFTEVLERNPDVRLFFNHDGLTLARTKAQTLELTEDDEGLRVWARLAPTGAAMDLRMAMQRGDVDQMSFAFTVAEDEWHEDHDTELVERTILRVGELFDVSVVSIPAYPDTDAVMRELRSAADAGKIHPAAQPETDVAGIATVALAETDPVDGESSIRASAETDPAAEGDDGLAQPETDAAETDPLSELKRRSAAAKQRAREDKVRLTKEMLS